MQTFRVLVVEDDELDAEVVMRALKSSGQVKYDIEHVNTLSNAFTRVLRYTFDIILLDLGLPDGFELNGLSKLLTMLDVPIVVLTGNDDPEMAEHAMASGAHDYVPKSENLSLVLHRTVQFAIQQHRVQAELARTEEILAAQNQLAELQAAKLQDKLSITERLASFAENTQQCVAILTCDGNVEWANEAFELHCNTATRQRQDVSLSECFAGRAECEWLAVVHEAVQDAKACTRCWTNAIGDSQLQWTRVEVTPMKEQSTGIQRFLFSLTEDILTPNTVENGIGGSKVGCTGAIAV